MSDDEERDGAFPYVDQWGKHWGYCNACGEEEELGQDCQNCDDGEVVAYDGDPDPNV